MDNNLQHAGFETHQRLRRRLIDSPRAIRCADPDFIVIPIDLAPADVGDCPEVLFPCPAADRMRGGIRLATGDIACYN